MSVNVKEDLLAFSMQACPLPSDEKACWPTANGDGQVVGHAPYEVHHMAQYASEGSRPVPWMSVPLSWDLEYEQRSWWSVWQLTQSAGLIDPVPIHRTDSS